MVNEVDPAAGQLDNERHLAQELEGIPADLVADTLARLIACVGRRVIGDYIEGCPRGIRRMANDPLAAAPATVNKGEDILIEDGTLKLWRCTGGEHYADMDAIRADPLAFLEDIRAELQLYIKAVTPEITQLSAPQGWVRRTGPRSITWQVWGYGAMPVEVPRGQAQD